MELRSSCSVSDHSNHSTKAPQVQISIRCKMDSQGPSFYEKNRIRLQVRKKVSNLKIFSNSWPTSIPITSRRCSFSSKSTTDPISRWRHHLEEEKLLAKPSSWREKKKTLILVQIDLRSVFCFSKLWRFLLIVFLLILQNYIFLARDTYQWKMKVPNDKFDFDVCVHMSKP